MPDYEKLYHIMFNAVTDALDILTHSKGSYTDTAQCIRLLADAQIACEEHYISSPQSQHP